MDFRTPVKVIDNANNMTAIRADTVRELPMSINENDSVDRTDKDYK